MKILTVIGARPQFIKAGAVSREISRRASSGANIKEVIVHTGQHYDENMSDIFFNEMRLPKPDYFLGIGGKTHGAMTGQMIEKIEAILLHEKPDWVIVYGDTNSTLAGALAASKLHIQIAHIEAGLRSFNMCMPEEINRILTDRVSKLLFCPTKTAVDNLHSESINSWGGNPEIVLSGDVMLDGAIFYKEHSKRPDIIINDDFILCTIHRAENTDDDMRLGEIINSLNEIAKNKQIILPLHPRTRKILEGKNYDISNLTITDPLGYLNMVWLLNHCSLVMTDSGGLQKEAFFFKKFCITLRDETEWVELVEMGVNILSGASKEKITSALCSINSLTNKPFASTPYGSGSASEIIITNIMDT